MTILKQKYDWINDSVYDSLRKDLKLQKHLGNVQHQHGALSHPYNISSFNIPAILSEVKSYEERTGDPNSLFYYSASKISKARRERPSCIQIHLIR